MTDREELLGRLTELDAGERSRRLTARSIQKMINAGDLVGAATALDDLEMALHPALAAGGGGGGEPFNGGTITDGLVIDTDDTAELPLRITPASGQSEDLIDVLNGGGDLVFRVDSVGRLVVSPQTGGTKALGVVVPADFGGPLINAQWGSNHIFAVGGSDDSGDPCVQIRGATGQTVDLLEVQDSGFLDKLLITADGRIGFFGQTPAARPQVPATPTVQDVVDALVALGLVTQAP